MSCDLMPFSDDWQEFIAQYEFEDKAEEYTNGAMLIPSFRVVQMVLHYFIEKTPEGLPCGMTISDDGEVLNWLGENYVKQSTSNDFAARSARYGAAIADDNRRLADLVADMLVTVRAAGRLGVDVGKVEEYGRRAHELGIEVYG